MLIKELIFSNFAGIQSGNLLKLNSFTGISQGFCQENLLPEQLIMTVSGSNFCSECLCNSFSSQDAFVVDLTTFCNALDVARADTF